MQRVRSVNENAVQGALRALAKYPGALYVGSARCFPRIPGVAKMSRI
jgi:hypothetical protein